MQHPGWLLCVSGPAKLTNTQLLHTCMLSCSLSCRQVCHCAQLLPYQPTGWHQPRTSAPTHSPAQQHGQGETATNGNSTETDVVWLMCPKVVGNCPTLPKGLLLQLLALLYSNPRLLLQMLASNARADAVEVRFQWLVLQTCCKCIPAYYMHNLCRSTACASATTAPLHPHTSGSAPW